MIKNHIVYNEFSGYQFKQTKAKGSFIWVDKNHKLIDFTSAWNVTNLGWNNEEIDEAMIIQTRKNDYVAGYAADEIQEEYAKALIRSLPIELDSACKATGGTEANEEALKIAWAVTGRKKIIGYRNTYHGHSFGYVKSGLQF